MSRIYEALKRAESEQTRVRPQPLVAEARYVPPPPDNNSNSSRIERMLESIPHKVWRPDITQLPTLGDGPGVEQFRSLRSRMHQFSDDGGFKSILVSSGLPAEGKSFVSANLAVSFARSKNCKVLLIDADLRRPSLCKLMGCDEGPGLADYLAGSVELERIVQMDGLGQPGNDGRPGNIPNLTFIPAGTSSDNAAELAGNVRFEELMTALSPHFDWIVVDSSPVLTVSDAVNFARTCDAVLLVARGNVTPFNVAQRAQAEFRNSRVLGFVLNAVTHETSHGKAYSYAPAGRVH